MYCPDKACIQVQAWQSMHCQLNPSRTVSKKLGLGLGTIRALTAQSMDPCFVLDDPLIVQIHAMSLTLYIAC